ncbi:MAG: glycoside hydrolase family 38 C-terminal domain-containing protein [Armatimonadota bacterium]|nr:glycoside hydrolase family 38 C-terminal domain-containing protein [Armatimonadota bacterium]
MSKKNGKVLHVVSSTHWDREWYYTFQQFRVQLVDLMDSLLDRLDDNPNFWRFMLDGQTSPLEDYLEIHPEKAAAIEKYTRGGQIELGPWYVLADEWLASPESHIRNMQVGSSIARKFGGEMRVGYLPDEFGHIAQMPQILNGFGFDVAFFSRGTKLSGDTSQLWWTSPDGSKVLGQTQSYGNVGGVFRCDRDYVPVGLDKEVERLSARTKTDYLLLINGGDHRQPLPHLPEMIADYGKTRPHKIFHSTLGAFIEDIKKSDLTGIPTVSGELRDGMGDVGGAVSLYNCASSRMFNKQANQRCNDGLEKWAEPFWGVAAALGFSHPSGLLWQAWKYLLQNYPHDSICGCSIDRVHDQMMTRFESTEEIAEKLTKRAMDSITLKVDGGKIPAESRMTTVWNPSTFRRSGTVEFVLDTPKEWKQGSPMCLIDAKGRRIPAQQVPKQVDDDLGVTHFTLWSDGKVNPRAFAFTVEDMPALGYRVYGVLDEEAEVDSPLKWGANWAENDYVKLKIAGNGSVTIEDKTSGAKFAGVGIFEDGGDRGGGYHFWAPEKDKIITSKDVKAKVDLVDSGPVVVRFRVELTMRVPERLTARRSGRISKLVPLKIVSYVTLGAKSKSVKFRTMVWNTAVDHRLRVMFPTGLKTDVAHIDGHFDVIERPVAEDKKAWKTEPHRRWVDVSDGSKSLTVMNFGLPEYEVTDEKTQTIYQTLFRSNTYVTKEWWATLRSPQAEMLGRSEYEYAIYAHAGDWKKGGVMAEAEDAMLPMKALEALLEVRGEMNGDMAPEQSLVAVDSPMAVTSIVKKADNRNSLVLRLYNPDKAETPATVKLWTPIKEAHMLDLWEERREKLETSNGTLKLKIPAKKIVTVEMVTG